MAIIKCRYCGKSYASPSEMQKHKCHSHPKGAWAGCCTPSPSAVSSWEAKKFFEAQFKSIEESSDRVEKIEKKASDEEEFRREYKKHTPLLDCMLECDSEGDGLNESTLQIRNSDLDNIAVLLANGINAKTREAINTIYALRGGCDYVLNNADAQQEGSLHTWLDEVKQLKDEVVSWDFWVALYFLIKTFKDNAKTAKNDSDDRFYWLITPMAQVFHQKQVRPMLRVLSKRGDEKDNAIMNEIESRVAKLKSEKGKQKEFDPRQLRSIEILSRRIHDYSFWGILYCLYWMKLRPTPWNDRKVWPIKSDEYGW